MILREVCTSHICRYMFIIHVAPPTEQCQGKGVGVKTSCLIKRVHRRWEGRIISRDETAFTSSRGTSGLKKCRCCEHPLNFQGSVVRRYFRTVNNSEVFEVRYGEYSLYLLLFFFTRRTDQIRIFLSSSFWTDRSMIYEILGICIHFFGGEVYRIRMIYT